MKFGNPEIVTGIVLGMAAAAWADSHPTGVPVLNSKPGAAYTLYLDFAGFNYTGTWSSGTPGTMVPFASVSSAGTFSAAQQDQMRNIWARASEKYVGLNINVTTVDPAVAGGASATDFARQAFYETQPKTMHTVITSTISANNAFVGTRGGVSFLSTTQNAYSPTGNGGAGVGNHTNWVFTDQLANQGSGNVSNGSLRTIAECVAHENGHGLRLNHQSAYSGATKTSEYSDNGASGAYRPIMGNSYNTARGLWRTGPNTNGSTVIQNDIQLLLGNSGMGGYIDDGVGHTQAGASGLATVGSTVAGQYTGGYITPVGTAPNAVGEANYTTDFFKFFTTGGNVSLTINESAQRLAAGVADLSGTAGMLDSTFRLINANGVVVATVTSPTSQASTLTANLPIGNYYLQVASAGGKGSTGTEAASYFDMGSYFITGNTAQSANALYYTGSQNADLAYLSGGQSNYSTYSNGAVVYNSLPVGSTELFFGASANVNTANFTTTLSQPLAVNTLYFGTGVNNTTGVTINGPGSYIYLNAIGNTGIYVAAGAAANTINTNVQLGVSQRWINNAANTLTVSGPVTLSGNTLTLAGTGPQAISGAINGSGGVTSTSSALVRLSGANSYGGRTKIDNAAGMLRVATASNSVILTGGGADVANGTLALEYSGSGLSNSVRLLLAASRNAATTPGVMDSGQIFSSTATLTRGLGYKDDGTATLIKPALFGDSDLDGGVSINDFNALTASFGVASGMFWVNGDFDYDGGVSINDFNLLSAGFGQSLPASSEMWAGLLAFAAAHDDMDAFAAVTGVPEPGVLGGVLVGGLLLARRRRL